MIVCYEGKMGSGMTLAAVRILYEESERRGLPVIANDWNLPYEHFDWGKFSEELKLLEKD